MNSKRRDKLSPQPAAANWLEQCSIGLEVRLEREREAVLGPRRAELLMEIDQTHSISAAARKLGISYRHAWLMVQETNTAAGETLVESNVGGRRGGGAHLTDQGRAALKLFSAVESAIRTSAVQALPRALGLPPGGTTCVHVLAAVSLQEALGQALAEFTLKRPHIQFRSIFGASNELAEHILSGAPADLFITADDAWLDRLESAGWLSTLGPRRIGSNRLTVVTTDRPARTLKSISDLKKLLSQPVAIADPSSPLGAATRRWLESVRLDDTIGASALVADNSRGVVSALRSGCARLAIIFRSDADRSTDFVRIFEPADKESAVSYVAAALNRGQRQSDAEALLEFLTSANGQRCLRRCGIEPLPALGRKRKKSRNVAES